MRIHLSNYQNNGPRKEESSALSKVDPSSYDHNNETRIAAGEQLSDRRYHQSPANPQDKTTRSTDVTTRDIALIEDPDIYATTDENYSTDARITDIDDPFVYTTAQNDRATSVPSLPAADQTTESESDIIDVTPASAEATTGTDATDPAEEPSLFTSATALEDKNASAILNKTTTDQAMPTDVYKTAAVLHHQTSLTGTHVSTTQILNASFTEAKPVGGRGHARVSTAPMPSDSMSQATSAAYEILDETGELSTNDCTGKRISLETRGSKCHHEAERHCHRAFQSDVINSKCNNENGGMVHF